MLQTGSLQFGVGEVIGRWLVALWPRLWQRFAPNHMSLGSCTLFFACKRSSENKGRDTAREKRLLCFWLQ